MIKSILAKLTGVKKQAKRKRFVLSKAPNCLYAIGDVHGCFDMQKQLEEMIIADGQNVPGLKMIIYLGDLVDRGPASADVIDHCMSPLPPHFERVCLCGNHDQALLDFYRKPVTQTEWFGFGGKETLASYGLDLDHILAMKLKPDQFETLIRQSIPLEHVAFLEEMPVAISIPEYHFVHAGVLPGTKMEDQSDTDLMWIRQEFLIEEKASDRLVVHGHTAAPEPIIGPGRIGVDTAAYMGGGLTAVRIQGADYSFISVQAK